MKLRAVRSEEQKRKAYSYFQYLERENGVLADVQHYLLYPGMEFGSRKKWWPDRGVRPRPHEGIDICYYLDRMQVAKQLSTDTQIPVMANGRVAAICRDFLGYSLFLDHLIEGPRRFCSVYAHILPGRSIEAGQRLEAGEVVGTIADTSGRKNRMVPHLHLSTMLIDREVSEQNFDWDLITTSTKIELLDPLELIERARIILPPQNPWKETGEYVEEQGKSD